MEGTVHAGGTGLVTIIYLLVSPIQSFLWKAVDFSLAFLSSVSTYQISQSRPYRVYQACLLRKPSKVCERGESHLLRDHHPEVRFITLIILNKNPFLYHTFNSYFVFFFFRRTP